MSIEGSSRVDPNSFSMNSVTQASLWVAKSTFNLVGRGFRELIHPIFFTAGGYKPRVIAKANARNLQSIRATTATPHLSQFIANFAPHFGRYKAQTMIVPTGFKWIVDAEEDLIATVTNHTITLIFKHLTEAAVQTDHDRYYPLAAITRVFLRTIGENNQNLPEMERAMGHLLYHNDPRLIPAPYPINRLVFSDIHFYFGSDYIHKLQRFCNTAETEQTLKESPEGRLAMDMIPIIMRQIESQLKENGNSYKSTCIDAILNFIPNRPYLTENLKQWFIMQIDEISKEQMLAPARNFLMRWIRAIMAHGAKRILMEKRAERFTHAAVDLAEGKTTTASFVQTLFALLNIEKGNGIGVSEDIAFALLPALEANAISLIDSQRELFQDLFSWSAERPMLEQALSKQENGVATQVAERSIKSLRDYLDPLFLTAKIPQQSIPTVQATANELLYTDKRYSVFVRSQINDYIQSIVIKLLYQIKTTITKKEKEDKQALTLQFLEKVLFYTRYHITSLNRKNSSEIPNCNELTKQLLQFFAITKETLPIPRAYRHQVWVYLTESLLPPLIKQALETYLTREALKGYATNLLKMQNNEKTSTSSSALRYRAPDSIRTECIAIAGELLRYLDLSVLNIIPSESIQQSLGHQIADMLFQSTYEWPMSRIYESCIPFLLEQLEEDTFEYDEFVMIEDHHEVEDYIGQMIEAQLLRALKSGARKIRRGVKKQIKKNVGAICKGAGGFLWTTGAEFVDLFSYAVAYNLFSQKSDVKMVRNGSQSFVLIGSERSHPGAEDTVEQIEGGFEVLHY